MDQQSQEDFEKIEQIDIQEYLLVLKRQWLAASGVFLTAVSLAFYTAISQTTVYKANGQLLFQGNRTSTLTGIGENIGDLDTLAFQGNPLDTQAIIIKSGPILQETIDTLDLRNEEGIPLDTKILARGLTIEPISGTDIIKVSYQDPNSKKAANVVNQIMKSYIADNSLSNRSEALEARDLIEKELPRTQASVERAAENLRQFKANNNIIDLDREAAATVDILGNLNSQINTIQAQLVDLETQVTELSRQVNLTLEEAIQVNSLSQAPGVQLVLTELQTLQSELINERTRYTPNHPIITRLEERESALTQLLQERIAQVLGSTIPVSSDNLQMGDLKRTLSTQLVQAEVSRLGLANQLQLLNESRNAYVRRSAIFPSLEKTQRDLEQKLAIAQNTNDALVTRLQEIQVVENQNIGNARIIQPARIPEDAVESQKKLIIVMGAFAGGLLGIAVAFLLDLLDRSIKTVKEAEKFFEYPILGKIPPGYPILGYSLLDAISDENPFIDLTSTNLTENLNLPKNKKKTQEDSSQSPLQIAFQNLQANLKFIRTKQDKLRTIVITSSVSGEDKSDVAANLASVMAQVGRKVLLVDADMRTPSQHHLWQLENSEGLSQVLRNTQSLDGALQIVTKNLSFLSAGSTPINTLTLLESERMVELMNTLRQKFDYIIFEAPPLVTTADAAILGEIADGVLLVVRPGVLDSPNAAIAKSLLSRSKSDVLGIVAVAENK